MELLEQKLKEYIASVAIPKETEPAEIKKVIEENADITAGMFLKRLKELQISGSEFLELLGNTKIGNMEFRRIEENPHLKFDELLHILDNSVLDSDDYRMIISVAAQRQALREERRKREQETLLRVEREEKERLEKEQADEQQAEQKTAAQEQSAPQEVETARTAADEPRRLSAAEEIFAKALADVEKQLESESSTESAAVPTPEITAVITEEKPSELVYNTDGYTESNINRDQPDLSYGDDESAQQADNGGEIAYEKPEEITYSQPQEKSEKEDEDDFASFLSGEKIGSTAKDIGDALGELVDYDEDEDENSGTCRRSRACLITSLVCVIILFGCAGALKALRYYGIIPDYVYEIPERIHQEITDFTSLFDAANAAEGHVSYDLPQELILQQTAGFSVSENAVGEKTVTALCEDGGKKYICTAAVTDGKLSDSKSTETDLENPSVAYIGGKFVLIGTKDNMTVVRFYDESTISEGKPVKEYKQSGKIVDYYTIGNEVYLITYQSFDLSEASSDDLTSFVPSFETGDKTSVVPFANISRPATVNRLNYYTVARISAENDDTVIKAVLCGDINGFAISGDGFYSCDSIKLNDKYTSRIARIAFDKDLSQSSTDFDGAVNPSMLFAVNGKVAAAGMEQTENGNVNVVLCNNSELSSQSVMSGVAAGEKIASAYCGESVLTLVSDGESPMQYNIDLNSMSMAEKAEEPAGTVKVNDKYYAQVKIASDGSGKRTGVTLSVLDGDKNSVAEMTASASSTVQGDWNSYLTSAAADDINKLAVYSTDDKVIFGVPLVYFDGISQVSEYRFYTFENDKLTETGSITLYDEKYQTMFCGIAGGEKPYIITMWDNRIITASADKIKVISDTVIKPA